MWPGITPLNVWEMRYDMWVLYVKNAEKWSEQQKKAREKKRSPRSARRR
ncbi:hypothetical protein GCM10007173_36650 [Glutamicibacter ardleyensis]|uniref:Uncharacterized protein n=1 Tax=Glutamicibacter ardleyensis TaxID=225894 RepID=A0ABQ2DVF4_9MICC|nr:hypothetical protein GCM10007173_36650 [Glutamicibacter ardleyensis]